MSKDESHLDHFKALMKDNPSSKAFAPLAEGYRKMGMTEKALQIALEGVGQNPEFNSGKVALAQVLIDLKKYNEATSILKAVTDNDFYNLLAHKLLGKIYIYQNEHRKALESYKAALLANPLDQLASKMVNKLESISAEDFDSSFFQETELSSSIQEQTILKKHRSSLNSTLSYIDALITKNNYKIASQNIEESLQRFPGNTELSKRQKYLEGLQTNTKSISRDEALSKPETTKIKLAHLRRALTNIETHLENRALKPPKEGEQL